MQNAYTRQSNKYIWQVLLRITLLDLNFCFTAICTASGAPNRLSIRMIIHRSMLFCHWISMVLFKESLHGYVIYEIGDAHHYWEHKCLSWKFSLFGWYHVICLCSTFLSYGCVVMSDISFKPLNAKEIICMSS